MADQVNVKLTGDEKDLKLALEAVQAEFKALAASSKKTRKTISQESERSEKSVLRQTEVVGFLIAAFRRLGNVAIGVQQRIAAAVRATNAVLLAQRALLPRGIGGQGGTLPLQQQRKAKPPANDRAQFFGVPRRAPVEAPVGTPIKDVNKEGFLTQKAQADQDKRIGAQREALQRKQFQTTKAEALKSQKELARIRDADNKAFEKEFLKRRGIRNKANTAAITGEQRKATSTRRSTAAIRKQSQPLTLLVAKFALMAFAVQTLANIVNSTFGAILKQIDDFQIAAVGTAVAVTGISKSTKPIGEIFNNNLAAAKQAFESLDLVAADFFATGAELQLAFNTLAQRGVIVREEEFRILGKLTDQIKLLTGGQNTQIQIQQELRAILDGNIRTTTAFGKSLQARGVDVKQLSKELRATGSIKVFEEFLTGLDAASGAIRRTLSSVSATFSTLFNQLTRAIFGETFDNVVTTVTRLNNLMIDQRDTIIQMGILIKNEISDAWNGVVDILDLMSATMIRLIQNDMVQFVAAFALAGKLIKRGPIGAILGVSTALTGVTGEASTFGDVASTSFNLLAIGIDRLLKGLDGIINVFKEIGELIGAFFAGGGVFGGGTGFVVLVKSLQKAETSLNDLGKDLDATNRQIQFLGKIPDRNLGQQERLSRALTRQLRLLREIKVAQGEVSNATDDISDTGGKGVDFLKGRTGNLTSDIRGAIEGTLSTVAGLADEAASSLLKTTKEEGETLLESFAKLASKIKIPARTKGEFEDTIQPRNIDRKRILEQFAEQNAKEDISRQNKAAESSGRTEVSKAIAKKEFDARLISGREFFKKQAELRREDLKAQTADANARVAILLGRVDREIRIIDAAARQRAIESQPAARRTNTAAIEQLEKQKTLTDDQVKQLEKLRAVDLSIAGLTKRTAKEESAAIKLNVAGQTKSQNIFREILALKAQGVALDEKDLGILAEQNRIAQELLDKRDRDIDQFGGATNAQQIAQLRAEEKIANATFAAGNTTDAQQTTFATQQQEIVLQKSIKVQIDAFTGAIDAAFSTLIDGMVEGAFEFRDLATTLSKDFITAGLDGVIKEIKNTVTKGLTAIFKAAGDGAEDAAAGAQRAAQGLTLAFGLLLAVLSRTGNKGEFNASGAGAGGGLDVSSVQTRGLLGGDQNIAIAEINNGLQEALIPTNAILSAIELNTRGLASLNLGIDPNELAQAITAQVQGLFSQALLQTP